MAKAKTVYVCQSCGTQYAKWSGKCNACGEWNTIIEEIISTDTVSKRRTSFTPTAIKKITEVEYSEGKRINLHNEELNRVLGGGLVEGSIVLLGGEPGIGKSTLLLQMAITLDDRKILYVSGEESEYQIRMRAQRIGIKNENTFLLSEIDVDNIITSAEEINPDIIIIDSIQTMKTAKVDSSPGTITQVRECTSDLQQYSKSSGIPIFLIGHITKDGSIAGPKILEHIVDTVLQFEGDRHYGYRILRTLKNRFGSALELGIFEMHNNGLREVTNPSEILLTSRDEELPGTGIAATIEGARPLLLEIQALVSSSPYGNPQRSANGFDHRRMSMILAVLEKRSGMKMGVNDVFLNVTGGIRIDDPAVDLAVAAALASSYNDIAIESKMCFAAEIGLSGEIRPVSKIEQRVAEADKLGFKTMIISQQNYKNMSKNNFKIKIVSASKLNDVWNYLFG